MVGVPISSSPVASGSYRRQSPSLTSTPTQEDLNYLKDLKFTVNNNGPFARIEGFFPNLIHYTKTKKEILTVYFILSPEYEYDPDKPLKGDCYCSEEELDKDDFLQIQTISSRHIYQPKLKATSKRKLKITCRYNSWVSLISSIFLKICHIKIL